MESALTVGEFLRSLSEMGFSEEQIQAAMAAGHFSVPEAAEWIVQEGSPRHRLVKAPQSPPSAFSAFNPPKDATGSSAAGPSPSGQPGPALVLNPLSFGPAVDPLPIESRIKQDRSHFQEQQRQRVAQEAQAERQQKKQERELILRRIAEDRRLQQEKSQSGVSLSPPASGQGQRVVSTLQTSVQDHCVLMIRLPSGECMHQSFPADSPLHDVVEHIATRHPSLPAFALLQSFPRKRFCEADLTCSLRSLGLTPNAALCVLPTPPADPQRSSGSSSQVAEGRAERSDNDPVSQHVQVPDQQEVADVDELVVPQPFPPRLWEAEAELPIIPFHAPGHRWGQGQRLVSGRDDDQHPGNQEQPVEQAANPAVHLNDLPQLLLLPENRGLPGAQHHWPDQGNRLREPEPNDPSDPEEGRMLAGQAAVERLHRAAELEAQSASGYLSPPKKAFRTPSVTSLCVMATRATVSLMTAPSMQYSSSLASVTPELAELLLRHMASERLLKPRTLELFFGCPLQRFVLNSYPYTTNELLRQLRHFSALKHLSLSNSQLITDAGLSVLSNLQKLQHLNLSFCTKLTDSCLLHITNLKSLSLLALDKTKVSDAGLLVYLQSAPRQLTHLSLNETDISETMLAALATYTPQLRLLSIARTKVSDVSALAEQHCLQTLHLDGTRVREDSLQSLTTLSSLSSLSLACIQVSNGDHTLDIISGLRLTNLTLPGRHSVTDAGLCSLSKLTLLSELDLTDYTQLTDQGITRLATLTRLKKLSLSNTQVTDVGLLSLVSLKELVELCLDRTTVTSRGAAALIIHLPYLQVIGLANTQVGDTIVRRGLVHCTQLLKLNLSRTRITDHGLKFLRHMKLNQINLDGTGVTLDGVANLISACPQLTSVRASHTHTVPPEQQSDDEDNTDHLLS